MLTCQTPTISTFIRAPLARPHRSPTTRDGSLEDLLRELVTVLERRDELRIAGDGHSELAVIQTRLHEIRADLAKARARRT